MDFVRSIGTWSMYWHRIAPHKYPVVNRQLHVSEHCAVIAPADGWASYRAHKIDIAASIFQYKRRAEMANELLDKMFSIEAV